jgi:hypothetical protein
MDGRLSRASLPRESYTPAASGSYRRAGVGVGALVAVASAHGCLLSALLGCAFSPSCTIAIWLPARALIGKGDRRGVGRLFSFAASR